MNESSEKAARHLLELREQLRARDLSGADAAHLACQAAADFLNSYHENETYLSDAVTLLCELAAHDDGQVAAAGIAGLFPLLIERLNDSFEPAACALYDRVFTQVIEFCRQQSATLDEFLRRFGLHNSADILARRMQLKNRGTITTDWRRIRKALLLSRVTLGADVAVTSVLMAALRQQMPEAELVLLGSRKLHQLFGGDSQVRVREVAYERGGSLAARLLAWPAVVAAVEAEQQGCRPDEICVIDPDSRLTQLGLLPVADDARYFFFESRSYRQPGKSRLSELAADWINRLLPTEARAWPYVALPESERMPGRKLAESLRRGGATHLVCLSFGVGGNARKRMPDPFEAQLLSALLADSTLMIDQGGSEDERQQISRLVERLRAEGRTVVEVNENNLSEIAAGAPLRADALTWDGGIGALAGLIAASDEYIGYDSAGQHIAAAQGVPTLTIFINSGSELFAERWHPHGPGRIRVVRAASSDAQVTKVLAETLAAHRELRRTQ
ncbi:MAG: hypothetical protein U0Z53_17575 [Blastocatellia bacterium]